MRILLQKSRLHLFVKHININNFKAYTIIIIILCQCVSLNKNINTVFNQILSATKYNGGYRQMVAVLERDVRGSEMKLMRL